jgi:tricorn protease
MSPFTRFTSGRPAGLSRPLLVAWPELAAPPTALPSFSEPSVSPNRQEIAFVSGSDVWTVPVTGSEVRLLVAHPATESRPLYARRTTLHVSADGKERDVVVRPLSRDTEKALDYHQWV